MNMNAISQLAALQTSAKGQGSAVSSSGTGASGFQSMMSQLLGQMPSSMHLAGELPLLAQGAEGLEMDASMLEQGLEQMLALLDTLMAQAEEGMNPEILEGLSVWQGQLQALLAEMLPGQQEASKQATALMNSDLTKPADMIEGLQSMLQSVKESLKGMELTASASLTKDFKSLMNELVQMVRTSELMNATATGKVTSLDQWAMGAAVVTGKKDLQGASTGKLEAPLQKNEGAIATAPTATNPVIALQRLGWMSAKGISSETHPSTGHPPAEAGIVHEAVVSSSTVEEIPAWMKLTKDWSLAPAKPAQPMVTMSMANFQEEFANFTGTHLKLSALENGMTEARIRLMPEHLGQLDIKITTHQGQVTAHFTAETLMAKEMLEAQMNQLRSSLSQQGLQVDKITFSFNNMAGGGLLQDGNKRQNFSQSQQQNSNGNQRTEGVTGYDQWMEEELTRSDAMDRLDPGQQFDATA